MYGKPSDGDDKYAQATLKVSHSDKVPQRAITGYPQSGIVEEGEYAYYYHSINDSNASGIHAVLSSYGPQPVYLYVNLMPHPEKVDRIQWNIPTEKSYFKKGTLRLNDVIVDLDTTDISSCFPHDQSECLVIFGIHAPKEQAHYSFIAY